MVDALPFSEVRGLLEFWAGKKHRELNKTERESLPSSGALLPVPPPHVIEAMNRHKQERPHARN
jgi:hypothetical protein